MEDEKKIVGLVNSIDEEITQLDNRMDTKLEEHEKDFLAAYRKHMIAVQQELTALKQKGTETELQLKQDKRIGKFKEDCTNIMKYCSLQKKIIEQKSLQ